jgi:nitroimidazol reductase NimA-like FMN-containing flavoprotein (pyridoxamine 5'-phosphate oxidase superfamily)
MPAEWAFHEVFAKAPYITVSMVTPDGEPYAIPLSLAMTDDKTFYFHSALEGKKSDIWASNPVVWLSAVSKCKPMAGPKDGSFTLEFRSATAKGIVELVIDRDEQIKGLKAVSERFLPSHMDAFEAAVERSLSRTAVYRITLSEPAVGKRKQYDANGDEMKYGRME